MCVVYSRSWDRKGRVTVTLLQFAWLIKMGAKSGKLQNFIVGLEHRITLKIEINSGELSSMSPSFAQDETPMRLNFPTRQILVSLFSTVTNALSASREELTRCYASVLSLGWSVLVLLSQVDYKM